MKQYQAKVKVGDRSRTIPVNADGPRDAIGRAVERVPEMFGDVGADERISVDVDGMVLSLHGDELPGARGIAGGDMADVVEAPGSRDVVSGVLDTDGLLDKLRENEREELGQRQHEPCPASTIGGHHGPCARNDVGKGLRCPACGKPDTVLVHPNMGACVTIPPAPDSEPELSSKPVDSSVINITAQDIVMPEMERNTGLDPRTARKLRKTFGFAATYGMGGTKAMRALNHAVQARAAEEARRAILDPRRGAVLPPPGAPEVTPSDPEEGSTGQE